MKPFKVIIWGYPLYSHTHSFVHAGWYKAFKSLGYDTYWFNDNDFPKDFDYKNCIFITEGYADKNIPIEKESIYFVHICKGPQKYKEKGCRFIDLRHNVKFTQDFSYDYVMNKDSLQKIDSVTYYEKNANDSALREKFIRGISDYEALYVMWATDLLPDEIDYSFIDIPKENRVYYVGSYWSANNREVSTFKNVCEKNDIEFVLNDPWKKATTFEENMQLVQKSFMAPDLRGSGVTCDDAVPEKCSHLSIGFVPCRTFKNISYGQLGITNSWAANDVFEGKLIYSDDIEQLFYKAKDNLNNKELIKEQMSIVKNNHTYVHRINSILSIIY